ncbi:interferon-induced GTP-binding protein Mx1 [Bombina bombina]|uniref:interferon-induced GTP-binding protein Mx1 n=1 Tax=Bombina bombina TaxID=8345 RepID=UPI00235ADC24|nr:interferon-induced GTP-binding protein Mx1 [Bombina bombina]
MDTILCNQYEEKIRPCIDLIDSLRALGIEKDLGLPAIAVIGDQSSGKSSVLEALSGVTLPRGSGIVTRCPLELQLKKAKSGTSWSGKMTYQDQSVVLSSPSDVEHEVKRAQDIMAGTNNGVSQELITMEIISPDVPDLTLIDLPGITRVALTNQPKDIGEQIKRMIRKYIQRQETISLVVIPSNVDIATTEALEMAREVDPNGERTLGILTKPDLVDRGTESQVLRVVRNLEYELKKGYMIVKCRGQQEISENLSLQDALIKERNFFEEHEHFSALLEEGYATMPFLAEKLTNELVAHIIKTLPALENQIKTKQREAEEKLKYIGLGVPNVEIEKLTFLVNKMLEFSSAIYDAAQGEEETFNGSTKLFNNVRRSFYSWECFLTKKFQTFPETLRDDMSDYEDKYRGRELPGFVSYRTFENIIQQQIKTVEEPAVQRLKQILQIVLASFNKIAEDHFIAFPNLYRVTKNKIEDIGQVQLKEAEKMIKTQFKVENVIYCQDTIYGELLKTVREKPGIGLTARNLVSVTEMSYHVQAYLKETNKRLSNQIPLIIQYYLLHEYVAKVRNEMMHLLQDKEKLNMLLQEKPELTRTRKNLKDQIHRLNQAQRRLAKFTC